VITVTRLTQERLDKVTANVYSTYMKTHTDHMICRYCGRIKHFYTRNGTSSSRFGEGCKKNPKGTWHFYVDAQ
jgi:Fe2+ or Zn2+ uptake regulation protein